MDYVYLFDTTLRDGLQNSDININIDDKKKYLDEIKKYNFDYIELSMFDSHDELNLFNLNLKNKIFLCLPTKAHLNKATSHNINNLQFLIKSDTEQIEILLNKDKNIYQNESIEVVKLSISSNINTLCIFEHFFDSYKKDKNYLINFIKELENLECKWIILADTNGGTLPHEIENILKELSTYFSLNKFGIHAHNDLDLAVANSIIAVKNGFRMVQGTWNGIGERCGNANLISVFCTLYFKLNYNCCLNNNFKNLTSSSCIIENILGKRTIYSCLPYVGINTFSHKAGLHINAIKKNTKYYEHINPELVGNKRNIILSEFIGTTSLIEILGERPEKKFLKIAKNIIINNKNKNNDNNSNNDKDFLNLKLIEAYKNFKSTN